LAHPQTEGHNLITFNKRERLCITAKAAADWRLWVILDRLTQSHQPAHVVFALKATKVLHGGETTICANCGREQMQQMQVHNADLLDYFAGTGE
jgi:hypothetical protein